MCVYLLVKSGHDGFLVLEKEKGVQQLKFDVIKREREIEKEKGK